MIHDIIDMDTKEKIRYVSESSNTSGYSTMSPSGGGGAGGIVGNLSPASSVFSSPAQSPATALQADFSNMNLPSNSPQHQFVNYTPIYNNSGNNNYMNPMVTMPNQFGGSMRLMPAQQMPMPAAATFNIKQEFGAVLRILEHPVEKFRFRYKSEMHGTHGSLNGASSKRTPKTFPEVELCNFNGRAVIRCSLFQTNLESPHSHQLVVRKDDTDICDPHDLNVSPEQGYVCKFQNMGIIHTAKKYILEELLKKKKNRLRFELGRDELSTKQMQELHKETEKEAKDMNLNQVRLCFEAFKVEDNNSWTRIAAPVYTNPINNRKSAQTGELRICRLSIATGSVSGGDDLILLVEKVSKKNIKVRFYEMSEDEDLVWEAFARFRESDVHHQYAIVCQTPAYRDKDIDRPVEVCIELVRPSDDERSDPPITFRYKPRDVVASRKRRRTCSTLTSSTSSSSSLNSFDLPKTIQEPAAANQKMDTTLHQPHQLYGGFNGPTISEEFKDMLNEIITESSEELQKVCFPSSSDFAVFDILQGNLSDGALREDGISSSNSFVLHSQEAQKKQLLNKVLSTAVANNNTYLNKIFKIYEETLIAKNLNNELRQNSAQKIEKIFREFAEKNEHGDTIIHEIITNDNPKICIKTWHILKYFQLTALLNRSINAQGQSGLHCACLHNRVYLVRPLLGLGCDPNIQDRNGNTALHIAVRERHQKCIESFLNMNSLHLDLNIKNDEGLTPLHLAIRQKDFNIAKKMLSYNRSASLICNTKDGNNALHMAVNLQNVDLVKYILEPEQFRNILLERNAAGQTAMDLARSLATKTGNEILALLSTHSKDVIVTDMVIKEEDVSSSSTEDDEDSESADKALEPVKVKEETFELEESQANNNDTNAADNTQRLQNILNDEEKFNKLVQLLDAPAKWRQLAQLCKMQHLLCLWSNSAGMLIYVKKNAQSIGYNLFEKALAEVDKDALNILLTT